MLTWISIYWFSRAGPAASVRIYFEVGEDFGGFKKIGRGPAIPSGVSYFPKEIVLPPARCVSSDKFSPEADMRV